MTKKPAAKRKAAVTKGAIVRSLKTKPRKSDAARKVRTRIVADQIVAIPAMPPTARSTVTVPHGGYVTFGVILNVPDISPPKYGYWTKLLARLARGWRNAA